MARISNAGVTCITAFALASSCPHGDPIAGVIVYGRVTSSTGASVSSATVVLGFAPNSSCATVQAHSVVSTDSAGRYTESLFQFGEPFTSCVKVVVSPPPAAPLAPDSVIRQAVPFTNTSDSVQIDITLQPIA
jgi:hypothetical protein